VTKLGEIEEASVGRRALIIAIADFKKRVLPDTTATAQKVGSTEGDSAEFGTQTVQHLPTPPPLPSTSSVGDVFETVTSPDSTRIVTAIDDDDEVAVPSAKEKYTHSLESHSAI
jgi:hypothetical protein